MIEQAIISALRESRFGFDAIPIFFNHIPEDVEVGAMIDTPIPGYEIDPDWPGYFNDMTELVIRHPDPQEGFRLCREAMKILTVRSQTFDGYHFNHIRPVTEPTAYPVSTSGSREFAIRFDFSCYRID